MKYYPMTLFRVTSLTTEWRAKVYRAWLDDIQDWCVSRQLWWGHRIPAYYCFESEAAAGRGGRSGLRRLGGCRG